MHFVDNVSHDPAFNLALEERLFRFPPDGGVFMLWRNEPSVIVGRFQNTAGEVNRPFARERGIRVARRMTGGGAVYHDLGNVNYSFILPFVDDGAFDFARFALPVVRVLERLGVRAEIGGRNDLCVNGRKISGSAQHSDGRHLLHHGAILFDADLSALEDALRVDEGKFASKGFASVRSRVANVMSLMPGHLTVEEFMEALRGCVPDARPMEVEPWRVAEAERLRDSKYGSWEWNWGESPSFTERKERRFPWGGVEALLDVSDGVIVKARFFGDYFGHDNRDLFERELEGRLYREDSLRAALEAFPPGLHFNGAGIEEFLDFLLS
ncbi:MAG: lipoate--protein ligase [Synergistaceae bacterium]|nr:lipoate--protein ligase [Synergistota bacterium]NLM71794.1 lipoate--protein ligase [Synergistaceae bacterium]